MKPPRGKRVDPQSLLGEFNLPDVGARCRGSRIDPARRRAFCHRRRVHFPRVERHDRFSGRQKPSREGSRLQDSSCLLRCYRPRSVVFSGPGDRGTFSRRPSGGSRLAFDRGGLLAVLSDRASSDRPSGVGGAGSVAIRSALHPTRLETRTKESNMCASHGVFMHETFQRHNESEGSLGFA